MHFEYNLIGVCSQLVSFELNNDIVSDIKFYGGCNGNLKAIATLCDNMNVDEIIDKLKGNTCGYKKTSCADQFALALEKAKNRA